MSEWNSILNVVETEIRAAVTDLPAGALGFERADGLGEDLSASELPHVFLRELVETAEEVEAGFGAEDVTVLMTFALWTFEETQEEVAIRLDLIRDELRGNRTLGGVVDRTNVLLREISEFNDRKSRRAEFVVRVEVSR